MQVARLLRLVEQDGDLFVAVRWKGLSVSDDTLRHQSHCNHRRQNGSLLSCK